MMVVSALGQYVATQPAGVVINDNQPAAPSPSVIDLTSSNIVGTIEKVTVTLNSLSHGYANDVGVLLVGPGGTVVLMNNSGGGYPINGATLTFDASAPSILPQFSQIGSGTYKPGDYTPGGTASFLSPSAPGPNAPAGPYGTLGSFAGQNPNGVWKLYLQDDAPLNTGSLGSWTLNLYTTPVVTMTNPAVTLTENASTPATVFFMVQDSSPPSGGFTWSFSGAGASLVGATVSQTSGGYTLALTPKLNQYGTNATLTLTVGDGVGSVQTNLTVTVYHVNQAPTLTLTNATVTTFAGVVSPAVWPLVADVDTNFNAANTLTLSVVASDATNIVAPSGVFFDATQTANWRKLTVVPTGAATGTAHLTLVVSDNNSPTPAYATNTLTVNVTTPADNHPTWANATALALGAAATSSSSITVSNVPGLLGRVTVAVDGLTGIAPNDLGLTLVGPGGSVPLLTTSANAGPNTFAQVLFADGAAASLPAADSISQVALQPASPLAALANTSPNGTWTLWVTNGGVGAQVVGGWVLNLYVGPTLASSASSISMPEGATTNVTITLTDVDGSVTNVLVTSANPILLGATVSAFNGSTGIGTVQMTANPPNFGSTTVQIAAEDNNNFWVTNTVSVVVTFVDHAPTISFVDKQVTSAGVPLAPVSCTVTDADLSVVSQTLTLTATSDNQKVLPDANILVQPASGGAGARTLIMFPAGTIGGTANVTLTVSDGTLTTSETFPVVVQPPASPLFEASSQININAGAAGTPYPSTNAVSGLIGTVESVEVTLFNILAPTPSNLGFLLVGPGGQQVLLMANAGGSAALGNTSLAFADSASNAVPAAGPLASGLYQPSAYGTPPTFPTPAPAGPYSTNLSVFAGTNPNTNWLLYVVDSGSARGGLIQGGWQLSIKTAPNIGPIADQTTLENTPKRVAVPVGDVQQSGITVSASTTNTSLIQAVSASVSGGVATVMITPALYQIGTAYIDLTATDGTVVSTRTFKLTVQQQILPPLVFGIANQTTPAAMQTVPITFSVWDPQSNAITVTATSDNPTLVPNGNISVSQPAGPGYATNSASLTILPAVTSSGTANITLLVSDGATNTTAQFQLTVTPVQVFANTNTIIIPEGAPVQATSTPYPSTNTVTGVAGTVAGVEVTLVGFSHTFPQDVDVLLVSPDGAHSAVLMAHAGGGNAVNNLRLTFSDGASGTVPFGAALSSGIFYPTNYAGSSLTFSNPAPAGPYTTTLNSSFAGVNPNGDWKLYVMDDTFPDGGAINGGWLLFLQTTPQLASIGPQTATENVPLGVPLTLSESNPNVDPHNLVVTASHSGDSPAGLTQSFGVTGSGAYRTLWITNAANLPSAVSSGNGTNLITVTVTDTTSTPNLSYTSSFPLTVLNVNQAPTVSTPAGVVYINENSAATISFNIADVDSTLTLGSFTVTSSDPTIVPNANVVIVTNTSSISAIGGTRGTSGTINVQVTPLPNVFGTNAVLSFVLTDGINTPVTKNVLLAVRYAHQGPSITGLPVNPTFVAGSPTPAIGFTVNSVEVSPKSLHVSAVSSNPGVVPNTSYNIVTGGSGSSRTISLVPLGTVTGSSTITVYVWDDAGYASSTNSAQFTVTFSTAPGTLWANAQSFNTISNAPGSAPNYPSTITVSGLAPTLFKASVVLQGLSHSNPTNLDVLLVAPDGTNAVMLMSGAGGSSPVSNLTLVFDDTGTPLPTDMLIAGTNHPGSYAQRTLPAPAPAKYLTRLGILQGINPNGTWSLYVNDGTMGDTGSLGGWQLILEPVPTIQVASTVPSPAVIQENSAVQTSSVVVNLTAADVVTSPTNLTVSYTSDNTALLPGGKVGSPNSSGNLAVTLTPSQLQYGTANLTFTVTRSDGASSSSAPVAITVIPVNVPPTISRLSPLTTPENTGSSVEFLVADVDTPLKTLIIQAFSSNQTLIANSGLVFSGSTNNQLTGVAPLSGITPPTGDIHLNLQPNNLQIGSANITIAVTDVTSAGSNYVTSNFVFTVVAQYYPPTLTVPSQPVYVSAGGMVSIPIPAASLTTPAPTLTLAGVSDNQAAVQNSGIVITPPSVTGSGNFQVQVAAAPGVTTETKANIILTVTDGTTPVKASFLVIVRPTRQHQFANNTPITINDYAPATPYPSTITTSGLMGTIADVQVTVNGFAHTYPSDVGLLLVSPSGQAVVLMNKAGDGHPVAGLNMTFSAAMTNPVVPQSAQLSSGIFRPADYKTPPYNFPTNVPTPPPVGPYVADLTTLNGNSQPNGTWSLYVVDDTPSDSGVITNGWSLAITTLPQIAGLQNMSVTENTPLREAFTIADDSPAPPAFTFTGVSSDHSVVSDSGIAVAGAGTNFTVTVTPLTNTYGTNITITLYATNGDNQTFSGSFSATFQKFSYPPVIVAPGDQTIQAGTVSYISLNYGNVGYSQNQLTVGFQSSDPSLLPVSNLQLNGSQLQLTPIGNLTGTAQLTMSVTNPVGQTATATFNVHVVAPLTPLFANTGAIVINDNNPATPYPSTIKVSGLSGNIVKVTATLIGVQHTFPSDISMLLVGPNNQSVVLMSRAGGGVSVPAPGVRLTFDDLGGTLPQFTGLGTGTYKPADYKPADSFFNAGTSGGPPAGPYSKTLNAFTGNPNGVWSLYVQDDISPDSGIITGGWLLSIETSGPMIGTVGPQATLENSVLSVPITVGSVATSPTNLVVTASNSGDAPAGLISSVVASKVDVNGNATVTITPAPNMPSVATNGNGTSTINVAVTDGTNTTYTSFPLVVAYVDQAPVFVGLSNVTTAANIPVLVQFGVTDVDTPAASLVVTANNTTPSLGSVVLTSKGNNQYLTFRPNGTATGPAVIALTASDGTSNVQASVTIMLTPAVVPPTFAAIPDRTAYEGQSLPVQLSVFYPNTPLSGLNFSAQSSNPQLVIGASFAVVGTNEIATLNLASNQVGTATVTIFVTDGVTPLSQSFTLTVTTAPTFGSVAAQVAQPGQVLTVPLSVNYPLTPLSQLGFSGFSSNPKLVTGFSFAPVGTNEVATINVAANQVGTATVTIFVTDGVTPLSQAFRLTVGVRPTLTVNLVAGDLKITFNGTPNAAYTIQSTTDLKTWTSVGTVTADANGAAEFDANVASGSGSVFYRAVSN